MLIEVLNQMQKDSKIGYNKSNRITTFSIPSWQDKKIVAALGTISMHKKKIHRIARPLYSAYFVLP